VSPNKEWRILAKEAEQERDPQKLMEIVEALTRALDEHEKHRTKAQRGAAYGMPKRNLKIIKLTPIALGICESCNMQFESLEALEDDAEIEMKTAFDAHTCLRRD